MECQPRVLNAVHWGDYPSYESQFIGRLLYFHDSRISKWHNHLENIQPFYIWVVVSNIFLFPALFGEDSHFDEYFSNRLKPPLYLYVYIHMPYMYIYIHIPPPSRVPLRLQTLPRSTSLGRRSAMGKGRGLTTLSAQRWCFTGVPREG